MGADERGSAGVRARDFELDVIMGETAGSAGEG